MRQGPFITRIAPGAVWPGSDGGVNLRPYRWVKIDNRGATGNDLIVGLNDNMQLDDPASWYLKVPAGYQRIFNISGPRGEGSITVDEIHLKNVGAATITVLIELDVDPIIDQQRSQPGGTATGQTIDISQVAGQAVPTVSQTGAEPIPPGALGVWIQIEDLSSTRFNQVRAPSADGSPGGFILPAGAMLYGGANWDRQREISPNGDGLGVAQVSQPGSTPSNNAPAANTAASIVLAAVAGQQHRLTRLSASYNAAPTAGNLLVQDGATTVSSEDVTAAGPLEVPLPEGGLKGSVNTAMTITLAAAGAAVTGKLNVAKLTA